MDSYCLYSFKTDTNRFLLPSSKYKQIQTDTACLIISYVVFDKNVYTHASVFEKRLQQKLVLIVKISSIRLYPFVSGLRQKESVCIGFKTIETIGIRIYQAKPLLYPFFQLWIYVKPFSHLFCCDVCQD